jgi:hypothetical protein
MGEFRKKRITSKALRGIRVNSFRSGLACGWLDVQAVQNVQSLRSVQPFNQIAMRREASGKRAENLLLKRQPSLSRAVEFDSEQINE